MELSSLFWIFPYGTWLIWIFFIKKLSSLFWLLHYGTWFTWNLSSLLWFLLLRNLTIFVFPLMQCMQLGKFVVIIAIPSLEPLKKMLIYNNYIFRQIFCKSPLKVIEKRLHFNIFEKNGTLKWMVQN